LVELLVVMGIIAVIASIGLPALRGLSRGNTVEGAVRQLRDDLALARLKAISGRTTVYMVFAPPWIDRRIQIEKDNGANKYFLERLTNLYEGQFTSYALVGARSMGDQPGQARPQYLTDWRRLPEGTFIETNRLRSLARTDLLPFPGSTNWPGFELPYIAFNPTGGLLSSTEDLLIPIAEGSVAIVPMGGGQVVEVVEQPALSWHNNIIRVNYLTGRTMSTTLADLSKK